MNRGQEPREPHGKKRPAFGRPPGAIESVRSRRVVTFVTEGEFAWLTELAERRVAKCLLAASAVLLPRMAGAQAVEPGTWRFHVVPYLWAVNMGAANTVGPVEIPLEIPFTELWHKMKFAGSVHGEFARNRWTGILDLTYIKLGDSVDATMPPNTSAQFEFQITIVEGLGTYRVTALENRHAFEVLGGVRYNRQQQDVLITTTGPEPSGGFDESWVDPIVGARFVTPLGQRFRFSARTDVGGFGVGSDIAFNAMSGFGWQISGLLSLWLEYRYMWTDYKTGTEGTPDYWAFKGSQQGILLGLGFSF